MFAYYEDFGPEIGGVVIATNYARDTLTLCFRTCTINQFLHLVCVCVCVCARAHTLIPGKNPVVEIIVT